MKAAPKQANNDSNRSTAEATQGGWQKQSAQASGNGRTAAEQQALISGINDSPRMLAQRRRIEGYSGIAQTPISETVPPGSPIAQQLIQRLKKPGDEKEETLQPKFDSEPPAQLERQATPKANNTGLPDNLKNGIEALSGLSLDHVKVHYNSSQPAQLNALAYAQGTDIHVGPGQEQHLPHEAWHVVQQAQGRVKPTMQAKGMPINNDRGLEREADVMGERVSEVRWKGTEKSSRSNSIYTLPSVDSGKNSCDTAPIQRILVNASGYQLNEQELIGLKSRYSAQSTDIDALQKDKEEYIVTPDAGNKITFQKMVSMSGKAPPSRLVRHNFDTKTQKNVPVAKGEHRRHIISHHLIKLAIDNWQKAHPTDMTLPEAQKLVDTLNNNQNNLIAGPGAENSAIGMFTNAAAGKLDKAEKMKDSMPPEQFAANIAVNLGQYQGFQQSTQAELMDDVLPVFVNDEKIRKNPKAAIAFGRDLQDSTDFDWPIDAKPNYYKDWSSTYNHFNNIKQNPAKCTKDVFHEIINFFISLPNPTK